MREGKRIIKKMNIHIQIIYHVNWRLLCPFSREFLLLSSRNIQNCFQGNLKNSSVDN
jgi:hypothetical protein